MSRGGSRYGAGRPGWRRKCEQSLALDIRSLHRKRLLSAGLRYSWQWTTNYGDPAGSVSVATHEGRIVLSYQWKPNGGDPVPVTCSLTLDRTTCNFGGHRAWFLCPNCGWRCAIVYFGGSAYACRKCLRLAYMSEAECATSRLWRKQRKLESRLGPDGDRPKGMHWRTWGLLDEQLAEIERQKDEQLAFYLSAIL